MTFALDADGAKMGNEDGKCKGGVSPANFNKIVDMMINDPAELEKAFALMAIIMLLHSVVACYRTVHEG